MLTADEWDRAYPRSRAAYPLPELRRAKYWPPVGRVENAAGDRNLVCSCPPIEAFAVEGPPTEDETVEASSVAPATAAETVEGGIVETAR